MGKRCAVDNCRSGLKGRKVSIFQVPKCPIRQATWRNILKCSKYLTEKDGICELHFERTHILKNYTTLLPDGTIDLMQRERKALKPNAVPFYIKNDTNTTMELDINENIEEPVTIAQNMNVLENIDNEEAAELNYERENNRNSTCLTFEEIVEIIKDINIEGWAWIFEPNTFIAYMHISKTDFQIKSIVNISNDLKITVSLPGMSVIKDISVQLTNRADVLSWLRSIENLKICVGTGFKEKKYSLNCSAIMNQENEYKKWMGFQRCVSCRLARKDLQKKQKR
ncbi:uncharacterized protein [Prorops nasuta]